MVFVLFRACMPAPQPDPLHNKLPTGQGTELSGQATPQWALTLADLRFPSPQELKNTGLDALHKVSMWNHGKLLSIVQGETLSYFGMHSASAEAFSMMLEQRSAQIPVVTFLQRRRVEAQLFGLMELSRFALDAMELGRQPGGPGGVLVFDMGGSRSNHAWSARKAIRTPSRPALTEDTASWREHSHLPHEACRAAGLCSSRQGFTPERFNRDLLVALPWESFRELYVSGPEEAVVGTRGDGEAPKQEDFEGRCRREIGRRYAQQLLLQQALRASLERQ